MLKNKILRLKIKCLWSLTTCAQRHKDPWVKKTRASTSLWCKVAKISKGKQVTMIKVPFHSKTRFLKSTHLFSNNLRSLSRAVLKMNLVLRIKILWLHSTAILILIKILPPNFKEVTTTKLMLQNSISRRNHLSWITMAHQERIWTLMRHRNTLIQRRKSRNPQRKVPKSMSSTLPKRNFRNANPRCAHSEEIPPRSFLSKFSIKDLQATKRRAFCQNHKVRSPKAWTLRSSIAYYFKIKSWAIARVSLMSQEDLPISQPSKGSSSETSKATLVLPHWLSKSHWPGSNLQWMAPFLETFHSVLALTTRWSNPSVKPGWCLATVIWISHQKHKIKWMASESLWNSRTLTQLSCKELLLTESSIKGTKTEGATTLNWTTISPTTPLRRTITHSSKNRTTKKV